MDDMTAFDRQIAGEVLLGAGPSEPVDDLAVYESVVAVNRQKGWGFTMFSALKFVVAGVIVALFGGFLLAGILTTQQDGEVPPAAATESPSPMTTEELLSGMVTEEVEPGVYRVLNDGVRDLASAINDNIVAGLDGSVWVLRPNRFLQLATDSVHEWPVKKTQFMSNFVVAPDGRVWGGWPESKGPIRSFDGEGWTVRQMSAGADLVGITPDGRVWAVWRDAKDEDRVLGYLGPDGWKPIAPMSGQMSDVDGRWLVTDIGEPWHLFGTMGNFWFGRFVDGEWQRFVGGGGRGAIGPDGTVWLHTDADLANPDSGDVLDLAFVRFDGSDWQRWPDVEGLNYDPHMRVATDGTLWLGTVFDVEGDDVSCDGVARFDEATWSRHLRGRCVEAMDFAADGSVWLLASDTWRGTDPIDLYVITPEAVAATE